MSDEKMYCRNCINISSKREKLEVTSISKLKKRVISKTVITCKVDGEDRGEKDTCIYKELEGDLLDEFKIRQYRAAAKRTQEQLKSAALAEEEYMKKNQLRMRF